MKLLNTSKLTQFLKEFDRQHPEKSYSQHKELKKYERVYHLRDHEVSAKEKNKIWQGF